MYNFKENESLYATIVDTVTPTTSTEGVVGQFYIDQSTDPASLYLCTKVETVDSTTTYTWTKQGGKQLYQHNINYKSTFVDISFSFINNISVAYTDITEINTYIYNNLKNAVIPATGMFDDGIGNEWIISRIKPYSERYCGGYGQKLTPQKVNITIDDTNYTVITGHSRTVSSTNADFGDARGITVTDTVVAL